MNFARMGEGEGEASAQIVDFCSLVLQRSTHLCQLLTTIGLDLLHVRTFGTVKNCGTRPEFIATGFCCGVGGAQIVNFGGEDYLLAGLCKERLIEKHCYGDSGLRTTALIRGRTINIVRTRGSYDIGRY